MKASTTAPASGRSPALIVAAFSRSNRPMQPMSWLDGVMPCRGSFGHDPRRLAFGLAPNGRKHGADREFGAAFGPQLARGGHDLLLIGASSRPSIS